MYSAILQNGGSYITHRPQQHRTIVDVSPGRQFMCWVVAHALEVMARF
jgi:hypothetical protein